MVPRPPVRLAGSVDLAIVAKGKVMGSKHTKFTQKESPDLIKVASLYTMGSVKPRHDAGPKSHGFGHGVEKRQGKLRLSGHPGAHQVGKK